MAELEPYLSHKDCGVASLGKVPEHWEVYPNTSPRGPFLVPSPSGGRGAEGEGPRTVGWAKANRPCPSSVTRDGHAALCPSYDMPYGTVVEYEPDPDLRDTEQVPLLEDGGIEAFLRREVLPDAPDAWYLPDSVKTGYEISFARYFYKPQPLRTLEEIRAEIMALEKETDGSVSEIVGP